MNLEEAIALVDACANHGELEQKLQQIVEAFGFASYCFLDTGRAGVDVPFYTGTTGQAWEEEYQHNSFIHVDEVIRLARRTNRPFTWGMVPMPLQLGRKKPGAVKTMEAAADYGFKEGFVVPFHAVDPIGRVYSRLCTLFWKDKAADFRSVISVALHQMHVILIYWMERSLELRLLADKGRGLTDIASLRAEAFDLKLTDRERDVMGWAARGKTVKETADILSISPETVDSYINSAVTKLGAGNKTHAVAKGIHFGLIDL